MILSCQESSDGRFRHVLERVWGLGGRFVVFVMLNPSIANGLVDDPTIRRCIAFAKLWGYDGMRVVNLVPFRATKPADMYAWLMTGDSAAMRANERLVATEIARSDVKLVVCAWGSLKPRLFDYGRQAHKFLRARRVTYCIKRNGDGTPAHPLYLKGDSQPLPYELFGA